MKTKFGTARINNNGYYRITSGKEGNHMKFLHRLIYEDFYGPIPKNCVIHHKDGDKTNNCIMNLQLIPQKEHSSLHKKGKNHHMWGKHHSEETRKKMTAARKGKHHSEETRKKMTTAKKGKNNPRAKYTLWDINSVHYNKNVMFNHNSKLNPRKCFTYKYKGYHVPIGGFHDFTSVEIINKILENTIK